MNNILKYLRKGELALFIIFLIVFIIFSFSSEYFFTLRNIMNVSGQLSIILIAAIGFSVLLIAGEVDISIGSLLAFVSLPLIEIMNITGSVPLGIILCLIFGIIIGLINGYLSVYLGVSSLIVTLGMLFILRGAVYLYTGQRAIPDELMFKYYNLRSYLRNMHTFYEYFLSTIIFYALAIIRNSRNCEAKRKRIDQTYKDFKIPIN